VCVCVCVCVYKHICTCCNHKAIPISLWIVSISVQYPSIAYRLNVFVEPLFVCIILNTWKSYKQINSQIFPQLYGLSVDKGQTKLKRKTCNNFLLWVLMVAILVVKQLCIWINITKKLQENYERDKWDSLYNYCTSMIVCVIDIWLVWSKFSKFF